MTGRPKISSSESQTGVEGENVNINCAAVVIPEYKSIVWTYHDSVLEDRKYFSLCIVCILVVHLCIQSLSRVCILLILMSITHDIFFCIYAHLVGNNRQHERARLHFQDDVEKLKIPSEFLILSVPYSNEISLIRLGTLVYTGIMLGICGFLI